MDLSKLNRRTFLQASAAAGLAAAVESSAAEGLVKTKAAPPHARSKARRRSSRPAVARAFTTAPFLRTCATAAW